MGQNLFKDYTIEKNPAFTGGMQNLWKVYNAVKADQSAKKVSIFMFDKKQARKSKNKEFVLDVIRKEA